MTDDAASHWARVVGVGTGPEAGFFVMPDVGDEVLIAFEHSDLNDPFIIGGLCSDKSAPPGEALQESPVERALSRTWHSRNGPFIAVHDTADKKVGLVTTNGYTTIFDDANQAVKITTAGCHSVIMDDQGRWLEIKTSSGSTIALDDTSRKATLSSTDNVEIKAGVNIELNATGTMDLQASGPVSIKGAVVNIN